MPLPLLCLVTATASFQLSGPLGQQWKTKKNRTLPGIPGVGENRWKGTGVRILGIRCSALDCITYPVPLAARDPRCQVQQTSEPLTISKQVRFGAEGSWG